MNRAKWKADLTMASAPRILIGISGGIAAYKIPQLVRLLRKRGAEVKVVLTEKAKNLVGEEALYTLSGNPVYNDTTTHYDMDHIRLAEWAQWFCICPATANTIAKIAHGIADNLVTTLALSIPEDRCIIAPAMNAVMWRNKATVTNIEMLKRRGIRVLPVGEGELACDTVGPGRMLEVDELADYILSNSKDSAVLTGQRVLISSGPTEEPIDPVRVITNRSSGRMGSALARAALVMGAEVTIVSGPSHVALPSGARMIPVRTAAEMQAALEKEFDNCSICIMAAAIGDYRPVKYSERKIPREENEKLVIELVNNPDILAALGKRKKDRFLVGFSLETGEDLDRAKKKMEQKKCDLMVFNRAGEALGTVSTRISLLYPNSTIEHCEPMDKSDAAYHILQRIAECLGRSHE